MMTVATITELLRTLKKYLLLKYHAEGRSIDRPEVNQSLNDMLNNIIIELETLRMKEQISEEDFESLVEIAEKYTCHLQL
jgi:ribonuclease PH